jgi:hypothetical protein
VKTRKFWYPRTRPWLRGRTVNRGQCCYCHTRPITGRNRKYCRRHSAAASRIWKRVHRRLWKADGDKYWLSDWKNKTPEERRAYYRAYMREYRRGQRRGTQAHRHVEDIACTLELFKTTERELVSSRTSSFKLLSQPTASDPSVHSLSDKEKRLGRDSDLMTSGSPNTNQLVQL